MASHKTCRGTCLTHIWWWYILHCCFGPRHHTIDTLLMLGGGNQTNDASTHTLRVGVEAAHAASHYQSGWTKSLPILVRFSTIAPYSILFCSVTAGTHLPIFSNDLSAIDFYVQKLVDILFFTDVSPGSDHHARTGAQGLLGLLRWPVKFEGFYCLWDFDCQFILACLWFTDEQHRC